MEMNTEMLDTLAVETITVEDSVDPKPVLMLAEFETADLLLVAAAQVRD